MIPNTKAVPHWEEVESVIQAHSEGREQFNRRLNELMSSGIESVGRTLLPNLKKGVGKWEVRKTTPEIVELDDFLFAHFYPRGPKMLAKALNNRYSGTGFKFWTGAYSWVVAEYRGVPSNQQITLSWYWWAAIFLPLLILGYCIARYLQ